MRFAVVVAVCLLGCTHDFDAFEPIAATQDAEPEVSQGSDTGDFPDTSTADTAIEDTVTPVDTSVAMDTSVDTSTAMDSSTPDTSKPDVATDTGVACTDAEGKVFGGHCYFPIGAMRWSNASSSCMGKGAHLVTITSDGEQTFVASIHGGKDRWIGLSRPPGSPSMASSFTWITGEAVGTTKWASGEPNGTGTCARMNTGNEWADQDCKTSYEAICERE